MEYDSGLFVGEHKYCLSSEFPKRKNGVDRRKCNSSDGLATYEHELTDGTVYYDAVCYSCKQAFSKEEIHSSSLAPWLGIDEGEIKDRQNFENKASKKLPITPTERKELWAKTGGNEGNSAKGYRGLSDDVIKFYGFRVELDNKGEVRAVYFPETAVKGKLQGYKSRHHPKKFGIGNVGKTGVSNELSGQCRFTEGGKHVIVCGGELDMASAQMMFRDYQISKNQDSYNRYSVVSPTTGEPSAAKQCRQQYDWFDSHDIITICMDADEVGRDSAAEIAKVLPKEKVRIMTLSGKDPNEMLLAGKQKQFMSDFFSAKELVNSGIFSSAGLMSSIKSALRRPRLNLPAHMSKLQEMTKGSGLIRNRIYSIIGDTSCGKTTHVNSMSYHWFFQPNTKVGIVSLEASNGEYGVDILSLHLSTNLYWVDPDNVEDYLENPEVIEKANDLFVDEYGESRFHILDDREGTVESLEKKCEQLYRQYGCDTIVIDVTTDLLRILTNEQQAAHYNWQSNFVKNGITIINVLHTRKPPASRDVMPKKPTEYDTLGSSIFIQKAAGNMVVYRNKACIDDPIEQNTTYWDVPKMRQGATGDKVMASYYDGDTRKTYDRDVFFAENPDKLPLGYDLTVSSFDKAYYEEGGRGWDGVTKSKGGFGKPSSKKELPVDNFNIDVGNGVVL